MSAGRTKAMKGLTFCSVVSKNYLGQARVLADSIRAHHPGAGVFVLLLDEPDGYFRPAAEPFTVVTMAEVFGADANRFRFQYTPFELSCAAKPYLMTYLIDRHAARKIAYFDGDMMVLHNMQHLEKLLDRYSIVVTPHLTAPYDDDKNPTELAIIRAGTFNMGFVAVAKGPTTAAFLKWWMKRLNRDCIRDQAQGLDCDQKWVNLVPGFFDDVHINRDPGYNVAYWNLHCRTVTARHGAYTVNGSPCYFFHFSGFDPARTDSISAHQNRFTLDQIGDVRGLLDKYRTRLAAHGHDVCQKWPYTWGYFDNGVAIPALARRSYLQLGKAAERFGDPFAATGPHSFFHWLITPEEGRLPPLTKAMYEARPDLRAAFPEPEGKDRATYLEWALTHGLRELRLDAAFEPRLRAALANPARAASPLGRGGPVAEAFGVNLLGFLQSEKGMGEHCRATIRSLKAAGIPHALNNWVDPGSANLDADGSTFRTDNPYPINLIHLNAIDAPFLYKEIPAYFHGRYNVGYWNWELDWFPEEWRGSFEFFDEILAPSTFSQKSYSRLSPVPVHWMPISIAVPPPTGKVSRERFGLPRDAFVFLFAFDFHSYFARKNPLAAIEAFRRAFPQRRDVVLALKLSHWESVPVEFMEVLTACRGQANIRILRDILSRDAMYDLLRLCDAYVGLHRSEGYGLPIVEAMALGKPVIATNYSGNVDFMNDGNSFPVRYRLVAIEEDHGPYRRGAEWAEPEVDHAAAQMRRVVESPEAAARIAARGRADIERVLSPQAIGQVMRRRITALLQGGSPAIDRRMSLESKRAA